MNILSRACLISAHNKIPRTREIHPPEKGLACHGAQPVAWLAQLLKGTLTWSWPAIEQLLNRSSQRQVNAPRSSGHKIGQY